MSFVPFVRSALRRAFGTRASEQRKKHGAFAVEVLEQRELLDRGLGLVSGLTDTPSRQFITGLYVDLLNRVPQAQEVARWDQTYTQQAREAIAEGFLASPEFQQNLITDTYFNVLGRAPAPTEVNGWLRAVGAGMDYRELPASFLGSDEYFGKQGQTTAGWLQGVYDAVLNRQPDAVGATSWGQIIQGGASRTAVARQIINSAEARTNFVNQTYDRLLQRPADPAGLQAWVGALGQSVPTFRVVAKIAGSPEYYALGLPRSVVTEGPPVGSDSSATTPRSFDFGTATSPVASGYARASVAAFDPVTGFGWQNNTGLGRIDRFTVNPLTRDFVTGSDATFRVIVPNGRYAVTTTLGDSRSYIDDVSLWLNDLAVARGISTRWGQIAQPKFTVDVVNGRLDLRIASLNQRVDFALDGLRIEEVSTTLQVDAGIDVSGNEGQAINFTGKATGGVGSLNYAWSFGDGSFANGTLTPSHTYVDSGNYTVTLTVTDANGQQVADTAVAKVLNVAPTGTLSNGGAVNEGSTGTVSFAGQYDPSSLDTAAGFKYSFDFDNNGTFEIANSSTASATVPASFLADGPVSRVVKGRIADKDGGFTDYTTAISVKNVAPTATLTNGGAVNEGSTGLVGFGSLADPSSADVAAGFKFSFDFDNNGTFDVSDSISSSATVPASFLADGPANRVVRGRIADKDGGFTDYTTTIAIQNVAPTVNAGGPYSGTSAVNIAFTGAATDPSPADTAAGLSYSWDFGDGSTSTQQNPTHAYAAAGTYAARLTVTDKDGGSSFATASVLVTTVAPPPTADAGPDRTGDEGTAISFTGIGSGGQGTLTYAWSFGDGGTASTANASRTYVDNGSFTATLTVTDGRGLSSSDTAIVTIRNVNPTGTLANAGAVNEGGTGSVNFSGQTDPSSADVAAGFKYSFDFNNDGTFEVVDSTTASATVPASYLADGPTSRVVKGRIKDKDGGFTDYTTTISVTNVAPTATLGNGGAVNEGSTGSVNFSGQTDPSSADVAAGFKYSFDFNNDGTFEVVDSTTASATVPASYLADGPTSRVVKGRIKDKDGAFTDYTTTISVTNVAPTATLGNGGAVNEGGTGSVNFSGASDPSSADVAAGFKYSFDFDNNGTFEVTDSTTASATVPASYLADGASIRVVKGRIKDKDGAFTDYTTSITVQNVAPTVNIGGPYVSAPGVTIAFTGSATDPSSADTAAGFSYAWDFGDGGTSTLQNPSRAYAAAGTFTVRLTVTDKDGGASSTTTTATVTATIPPPTANAGPDKTGNEGTAISFAGTGSGGQGTLTYAWTFGDGGTASTANASRTYADNGTFTATLTVTDSRGLSTSDTAIVTVSNVVPTGSLGNGGAVNEGSTGSVNFSSPADPSSADVAAGFKYSFDFDNNGTFEVTDSTTATATVPATYLADGPASRVVKGRIKDKDGGFTDYTTSITINNVAPTATLGNGGAVNEGSTGTVTFSNATDVSSADRTAGFKYSFDFDNNGTFEVTDATAAAATVPASFLADGPGSRVVKGRVKDKDGAFTDYTTTITINNVAPTASAGGPYSGSASSGITFNPTATDPSSVDTAAGFTYSWSFGDGGTSTARNPNHMYAANGTYTVSLTVRDKDNAATTATTTATIGGSSITVSTVSQLQAAIAALQSGQTIIIAAGTYQLPDTLYLPQGISNVTIRGATGNPADVIIQGNGMAGTVRFGFWLGNVQNATFADFTVRNLKEHGFILNAGVEAPTFRNLQIRDIGDQFIKANPDGAGGGVDNGLVENCLFEYTTSAPDYYTNGVDVHTGFNWIIRKNVFRNFVTTGALAGPAVLMWNKSGGTITEGNTFINNARDIAYGLDSATPNDHQAGIIRNNFIIRPTGAGGDVAIGVFNSPNTEVLHNTVKLNGNYPNAVEYRFASTTGVVIRNNLTDSAIASRDGATGTVSGNITNAQNSWFVNAANDLHLTASATSAINTATVLANVPTDFDGQARPIGSAPDVGADEYQPPADVLPPTVSITSPSAGASVSATVTVSATATDNVGVVGVQFFVDGSPIGAEDTTSPYSIGWDTTTIGNGNHALTARARDAAGNLGNSSSVTVSVSNSTAQPNFIVTPYDSIPNFGKNPTIVSSASGNWSNAAIWVGGRVPAANDVVSIAAGTTITFDTVMASADAVKTVAVQAGGKLIFRTDVSTTLFVSNLLVLQGGELVVGSATSPIDSSVSAQIIFADKAIDTTFDPNQYGNGLIALGKVSMAGAAMSDTFIRVASEPKVGQTTLTLANPVTGWKAGQQLVLPDTRQITDYQWNTGAYTPQWEVLTIASISADGKTVTLTSPLQFNHLGARNIQGGLDFLPYVNNINRNVVVRSENMQGNRGHVMFTYRADVDVRYAQFGGLGRTKTSDITASFTQDRNAVQFRHLFGPAAIPANGYQYTFVGNTVRCPLTPMTFAWGVNINDSHYGLIKDNVLYNWAGAGLVTKTGAESGNVIEHNSVVRINGNGQRDDDLGLAGTGFWLHGPNNYVRDNVVANLTGGIYSYGFNVYARYLGTVTTPAFQGADPSVSSQRMSVNMNAIPLREFARNEAYGAIQGSGLSLWWIGTMDDTPYVNVGESVVKDFRAWNFSWNGIFCYPTNHVTIDGFVARGDPSTIADPNFNTQGIYFNDYMGRQIVIRNANIQGLASGIVTPYNVGRTPTMDTTLIENTYLANIENIGVSPPRSVNGSGNLSPKRLDVRNVTFAHPSSISQSRWTDISMSNVTSDSSGVANLNVADLVYVYAYNGNSNDSFQVFYSQRAPANAVARNMIRGLVVSF